MTVSLYDASVPVLTRYLIQLAKLVGLAEGHVINRGIDPDDILQARLAPDMLPFVLQVQIASNFSVRICAPLADVAPPALKTPCQGFSDLSGHLASALAFLASLTQAQLNAGAHRIIHDTAGEATLSLPGDVFLFQYALPNFFFHATTAYAILRHRGVPVGKADFDGFHAYTAPNPAVGGPGLPLA